MSSLEELFIQGISLITTKRVDRTLYLQESDAMDLGKANT